MEAHIEKFKRGTRFVDIVAAVTSKELLDSDTTCESYKDLNCIKFIPASGAATRMFKGLYEFLETGEETKDISVFFDKLEAFSFYGDLEKAFNGQVIDKDSLEGKKLIIETLLNSELNYGNLPKALIKFHTYDGKTTTPIDEHIYEGEQYLCGNNINLHFTISKEHESQFNAYVANATEGREDLKITYSFQKKETDTLAVDMDNQPFKLDNGEVLYRAGGHGSLVENLNDLDCDIIFIKNIDNVSHQSKSQDTIDYKKKLAAIGYHAKQKLDQYIVSLEADDYDLEEIKSFITDTLHVNYKTEITKSIALKILNRPLRVCGMVKNQGEPGGGPFIVDNGDYTDLQVCEMPELDRNDENTKAIINQAAFFNPADIVCFVRDYKGDKFNLKNYINEDRYFISQKSYKGRDLKALEHPGLWNGTMHNWNALFVEVPLTTFNPVKTVNDLLRDGHQK